MKKGTFFVLAQFTLIITLFSQRFLIFRSWSILFHLLGVFLGLWAVLSMKKSKLNVFPELKNGASLVQKGPYQWIRHPMYSSILLFFLPHLTIGIIAQWAYLALIITLIFKLRYEELLLSQHFSNYKAYQTKTFRLIPFFF